MVIVSWLHFLIMIAMAILIYIFWKLRNLTNVPTNYRPKIMDGSAANNDRLFRNEGNGTFKDVTIEAGIVYEGFGLGLSISDVNMDGWPDIYVSNDYLVK